MRPPEQPQRTAIRDDELALYDEVVGRQTAMHGRPNDAGPFYGGLLNSPPFASQLIHMGTLVRSRGDDAESYSHADREWVDIVLSHDFRYYTVLPLHIPDALATGVRLAAIIAIWRGQEDALDDHERLLTTYIRQVVSGSVTTGVFEQVEQRLGTRGIVEYTVWINHLTLILRTMSAFGIDGPTAEAIDTIIDGFEAGSIAVPSDFRSRIR